jgi:anti-sigma-K factor RskA
MTMMDDDKDGLASEYVLGTLDADERAQAEALMTVDPAFAETVRRWERRLGELNALVAPVEPPAAVWEGIKAKLPDTSQSETVRLPEVAPLPVARAAAGAQIVDLTQRMHRWRARTVITGALAACLAAVVVMREVRPDFVPPAWRPKTLVVERVVEKPVEVVREVVREVPSARAAQFVALFQKY